MLSLPVRRNRLRASARMLRRSGVLYILTGSLGYAFLPVWVRWLEPSGLTALDMTFWRYLLAVPAVWATLALLGTPAPTKALPWRGFLVLGLILAATALSAFIGLQLMPVPTYALLIYSYPAQVAFINYLLGERLSRRSWLALLATSSGILLTLYGVEGGFAGIGLPGAIVAFLNALFIALYFLVNSRVMRGNVAIQHAAAWATTAALIVILPFSLFARVTIPTDLGTWLWLTCLAVWSTVMPIFMYMTGIQRLGSSRAAILSTSEPVLTSIIALMVLGEALQPLQIPGGALIILSIVLLRAAPRITGKRAAASV